MLHKSPLGAALLLRSMLRIHLVAVQYKRPTFSNSSAVDAVSVARHATVWQIACVSTAVHV